MAGSKGVVLGFLAAEESGQAAVLFDSVELISPTGQYFMCVCLMSYVPNEPVIGRVENVMHGHSKLNSPEAGTCMAADTRASVNDKLADLVGHLLQVLDRQPPQICRRVNVL